MQDQGNSQLSFWQRWDQYSPSKKIWLWTAAFSSVLTIIIGFTFGGWITGRSSGLITEVAVRDARAELAASECVSRFVSDVDAKQQLIALKALSSWQRDDFVRDGGWVQFGAGDVVGADVRCADTLAAMDNIPELEAASTPSAGS